MFHWDMSVAFMNAESHETAYVRFPSSFPTWLASFKSWISIYRWNSGAESGSLGLGEPHDAVLRSFIKLNEATEWQASASYNP